MDSNQSRLFSRISLSIFLLISVLFCNALSAGASTSTPILYAEPLTTAGTQNTIYWNGPPPEGAIRSTEGREAETRQGPLQASSETIRSNDQLQVDDGSEPAQAILNLESTFLLKGDEDKSLSASGPLLGPVAIFNETFEGAFPGTSWTLSGSPTWGITSYDKYDGYNSAWCGGNSLNPVTGYANNMSSSMVYGPFSLADATSANVSFWYKNLSEPNWDYFGWYASKDGVNFYGSRVSGDQNSWRNQIFDLASIPTIGDLRGKSQVWIAFIFTSDGVGSGDRGYKGAYVDDIVITKNNTVLPNLTPYQPPGWSDKILVANVTGTTTDSGVLYTSDTLYVDWAVINNGTADTEARFYTELYVDDVLKTSWYKDPPLSIGSYIYVLDYSIGSLAAGTHTIRIKTDSIGAIEEGVESDNEYTKTITVTQAVEFFYAECADNSSFTNARNSPWTRMNSWNFTGLTVGQTYWYRVKGKISTTESDWSNVEFSQQVQSYPGILQFSAPTYSVNENGGVANITITRIGGTDGIVGAYCAASNGTATAWTDYVPTDLDLSWADGDSSNKTFAVQIINNTVWQGDRTVNLALAFPTNGATLGSQNTAVLNIIEDEQPPVAGALQFSAGTYSVNENGQTATITVTRTMGNTGAVSVHYATSNGTAFAGSDYTAKSGNLTWTDGDSSSKTFAVSITNNTIYKGNRTVNLTLSSPTGGALLAPQRTAVLTIIEDDPPVPGTLQFSAATYSVNENGGTATITVKRTGGSDLPVSVHYATSNGTATAGNDYTATFGDLSWADKDSSSKTFTVSITNDTIWKGNRTINLTLSSPTGGALLGSQSTAMLTIVEDEVPVLGTLQFSAAAYSVNENGGTATITVTRTGGSDCAVGVHYATSNGTALAGSDYTAASGNLNWADKDSSSKTFTVSIINDTIHESSETVNLTLSSPTGGALLGSRSTAVLTIIDDDLLTAGTLQFSAAAYSVNENGGTAMIIVTRTGGSDGVVGVHYATSNGTAIAGSDYVAKSGTLSWSDKDSSNKTFTVNIYNDSIYKGNRTVNLTLSGLTGGATPGNQNTAVLTIIEDDPPPISGVLQFSAATYSVNENAGTAMITITRTGGSSGAVGVQYTTSNGTAIAGSDYTAASGVLSWLDKDSSNKMFTVNITDNHIFAGNKTINLALSNPTGGVALGSQKMAVLTILDNDTPAPGTLQFNAATYDVNENGGTATIIVTRTGGSDGEVGVHYATSNGTAIAGNDYTATSGDLSWADKDSSNKTFTVNIYNDSIYKGNRTVNLVLSSPTGGATIGAQNSALLTIIEDDPVPQSLPWLILLLSKNSETAPAQSQWESGSEVYCSTSPTKFSLFNSGKTKNSYIADFSTDSTWEGWATATPRIKSFSWKL